MRSPQSSRDRRELTPFSGMRSLMSRFDDMFNEFERDFFSSPSWSSSLSQPLSDFSPSVDVQESEEMYMISADLPGVKKDDVKIDLVGNSLKISGERTKEIKEDSYSERSYGRFSRSFTLPQNVDPQKVEAHFEDGVLRIVLPKTEVSKAQSIKIESGSPKGLIDRFLHREKTADESIDKNKH